MEHIRDIVTRKGVRGLYSGIIFEYYKVSELVYDDMTCVVVAESVARSVCVCVCVCVCACTCTCCWQFAQYDDL